MPLVRGALWINDADLIRAMPSRLPESLADKQAKQMMTSGNNPLPTHQIQQGPSFCSSCGKAHRLGTACPTAKAIELQHAFDVWFAKADGKTVIVAKPKGSHGGNPYHDSSSGKFTSSGHAEGAKPVEAKEPRAARQAKRQPTEVAEASVPDTTVDQPDSAPVAHAATQAAPRPVAAGAPVGGGAQTAAGRVGRPAPATPPVAEAPAESPRDRMARIMGGEANRGASTQAGQSEQIRQMASEQPMRRAEAAYKDAHAQALAAGHPPEAAHQQGVQAAHGALAEHERQRVAEGSALESGPPAFATQGSPPPSAAAAMPRGPATVAGRRGAAPGGDATNVSGPPTGMARAPTMAAPTSGPEAPTLAGQAPPGGAPPPGAPAQQPQPGASLPNAPGGGAGRRAVPGLLETVTKPWAAAAGGMGSGMFTPGGTAGATAGAIGGSAHGILSYGEQEPKPAAEQRAQRMKQISQRSPMLQQESTQHLNRLRSFAQATQPQAQGSLI